MSFLETCGPNFHSLYLCLKFINTMCYGSNCLTAHKSIKIFFFEKKYSTFFFAHFAHTCYMYWGKNAPNILELCIGYSRDLLRFFSRSAAMKKTRVIFSGLRIFCLFVPKCFFSVVWKMNTNLWWVNIQPNHLVFHVCSSGFFLFKAKFSKILSLSHAHDIPLIRSFAHTTPHESRSQWIAVV